MNSNNRLYAWLNLRPGEEKSASLMLLHSFFMGIATVFFETAASAFFLAQFDATALPFVYLAAAAASISTGLTYTHLKDRLAFTPLMVGTLGLLFVLVCLMRLGLSAFQASWLVFSMMVAYRLISILTDLEFWAVAARLYDVQQSKRLFSLIGSGEVTARILGAFSVPLLVMWLGVANLLWISAAGLLLCALILSAIVRSFPEVRGQSTETVSSGEETRPRKKQSIGPIWRNRYFKLVFLLAFCAVLGKYFVDFAFLTQMQTRWQAVENLASFFGLFSGVTQVINLLIRAFISSRLLNRFGVGVGLLVLPVAHIICTFAIAAVASAPAAMFWLVIANQGFYKTLKHPLDNPSFKILYQPLPRRERLAAQIVVEAIVTPLAIALAAVLIIVLGGLGNTSTSALTYLMLANFAAWTIVASFVFREYGTALVRALEKRSLDRTSFSIEDEKSVTLIRSKLTSEYPEDVIFALDLLQRVDSASIEERWSELLTHPSDDVRRYVLMQIETHRPKSLADAVGRLVSHEGVPVVKAVGLRALAALGDPTNLVAGHLHDPDRAVERGALIGVLQTRERSNGAARAQQRLEELAIAPEPADRVLACKVLGDTVWHETSSILLSLLEDGDRQVRCAALRAAGKRRDPSTLEIVIRQLEEPRFRADASRALRDAPTEAAPLLAKAIVDPGFSSQARARMARLAGRLSSFDQHAALWHAYQSFGEPVRQEALLASSARGYSDRDNGESVMLNRIESEVEEIAWGLGVLRDLRGESAFQPLVESLRAEIEQSRDRVLLLLSFIYNRQSILTARDNLQSSSREKRAYAAEILEVTLAQEVKELTLPLTEDLAPGERLERLERRFPQKRRHWTWLLREIFARDDRKICNWTKACAIYGAATSSSSKGFKDDLARLSKGTNLLVAETSRWALQADGHDRSRGMLTIEKVILLKGVGMFAHTSEDILADVAAILEEVELSAGEPVFHKGEQGDSMYIIIHGRVRIFDGEKTINFLGEREIFGELALLDPEPRSASVEAVEETQLFRLERGTLFELMEDSVSVVSGIMHVLCSRLRRMTAIATGDN